MKKIVLAALLAALSITQISFAPNGGHSISEARLFGVGEKAKQAEQKLNRDLFAKIKATTNYNTPIEYKGSNWFILNKEYDANGKVFGQLQKHTGYFALNNKIIDFNEATGQVKINPAHLTGLGQALVGSGLAGMAAAIYYSTYGANMPEGLQDQLSQGLSSFRQQGAEYLKRAGSYIPDVSLPKVPSAQDVSGKISGLASQAGSGIRYGFQSAQSGISSGISRAQSFAGAAGQRLQSGAQQLRSTAVQQRPAAGYFQSQPAVSQGSLGYQEAFRQGQIVETVLP